MICIAHRVRVLQVHDVGLGQCIFFLLLLPDEAVMKYDAGQPAGAISARLRQTPFFLHCCRALLMVFIIYTPPSLLQTVLLLSTFLFSTRRIAVCSNFQLGPTIGYYTRPIFVLF